MNIDFTNKYHSETINYNDTKQCQEYLHSIFRLLINTLRIIVSSNDKLVKSINKNYEDALIKFLDYIPNNYMKPIFSTFESIYSLIICLNIDKLIANKNNIKIPYDFSTIEDKNKIKGLVNRKIEEKFKEPSYREFLKSLVNKLDPVFNCLMYVCQNTSSCIQNCIKFKEVKDIF